jgi:DNA repair protein RadC
MDITLSEAERIKILNADDLYDIMQRILLRENKIDKNREHFWVAGLENNHRLLFIELISLGTVNKTFAEPMEVFSLALQKRAVKIVLIHNHPTGELKPSDSDKDLTDRLIQVGLIVNTQVVDHLIITEKSYLSFEDTGLMEQLKKSTKWVPAYKEQERIKNEAKEIGVQIGMIQKAKQIALELKKQNISIETIVLATGLTEEEVRKIK